MKNSAYKNKELILKIKENERRRKRRLWNRWCSRLAPVAKRLFIVFLIFVMIFPQLQISQFVFAEVLQDSTEGGEGDPVDNSNDDVAAEGDGTGSIDDDQMNDGQMDNGKIDNGEDTGDLDDDSGEEGLTAEEQDPLIPLGEADAPMRMMAMAGLDTQNISGRLIFMGTSPETKNLILYQDDEPLEGSQPGIQETDSDYQGFPVWNYEFTDLPISDEDGNVYQYSIRDTDWYDGSGTSLYYLSGQDITTAGQSNAPGGTDLIYVSRKDVTGAYRIEKTEDAENPDEGAVELSCSTTGGEENTFGNLTGGVSLSESDGTWQISDCLQYNPQTGEEIEYRVQVDQNADDYLAYYENVEPHEGDEEYLYEGGTLVNVCESSAGILMMEILSNPDGPQPGDFQASGETSYVVNVKWNDNNEGMYDVNTNPDGRVEPELEIYYMTDGMQEPALLTDYVLESWFIDQADEDKAVQYGMPAPNKTDNGKWTYTYALPKELAEVPDQDEVGNPIYQGEQPDTIGITYSFMITNVEPTDTLAMNYDVVVEGNTVKCTKKGSVIFDKVWRDASNDYLTRSVDQDQLKSKLTLFRMIGTDTTAKSLGTLGDNATVKVVGDTWTYTISQLPQYDADGMPYIYYVTEGTVAIADGNKVSGATYKTSYENIGNYVDRKDACYNGGQITNTLNDYVEYAATKKWLDDDEDITKANRPEYTLILMRYLKKEGNDYRQGSPVQGMRFLPDKTITNYPINFEKASDSTSAVAVADKYASDYPYGLPRFDEEGYEYIYYVQEVLADNTYKKSTNALLDGGILENVRVGTTDVAVTKTWKAAAIQNMDASIKLELKRQLKNTTDQSKWDVIETIDLGGFRAETMEKTHTFASLPKYDARGLEYKYSVSEKAITIAIKGTEDTVDVSTIENDSEIIKPDGTTIKTKTCVINGYGFELKEETDNSGNIQLTNRLIGTTDIWVKKIWNGLKSGQTEPPVDIDFIVNSTSGTILKSQTWARDGVKWTSAWEKVEDQLRYDEEGREIKYAVSETAVPEGYSARVTYESGEVTDTETGALKGLVKATITNTPTGNGKWIEIYKDWKDDGDENCRGPVTVALYHKADGGSNWKKVPDAEIELTQGEDWRGWIRLTGPGSDADNYDEDPNNYYVKEVSVKRGNTNYFVEEKDAGSGFALSTDSNNPTEIGTLKTDAHFYNVEAYVTLDKDHKRTMYTFRNTRFGTVNFDLQKEWNDADYHLTDVEQQVTLEITRRGTYEDESEAATVATVTLNGKTSPYQTLTIATEFATELTDVKLFKDVFDQIDWSSQFKARVTGFPKYDEKGVLYLYTVKEVAVKELSGKSAVENAVHLVRNGEYTLTKNEQRYSVSVRRNAVWGEHNGGDIGPDEMYDTVLNARSETISFKIHKIWRDITRNNPAANPDARIEIKNRPDIYLTLWRQIGSGEPKEMTGDNYVERVWDTTKSDYYWICDFGQLPRYNSGGEEITYWAVEDMPYAATYEYADAEYYACEPEKITEMENQDAALAQLGAILLPDDVAKIYEVTGEAKTDKRAYNGETIVNRRAAKRFLNGQKIWLNLDNISSDNFPEVKLELRLCKYNDQGAQYEPVKDGENKIEVTLHGGQTEFTFGKADGEKLPKYDEYGTIIKYRALEPTVINGYAAPIYDEYNLIVKNIFKKNGLNEDEKVAVTVSKTWAAVPNDTSVTAEVKLWRQLTDGHGNLKDGTKEDTEISTTFTWKGNDAANTETYTFTELPLYGYNGNKFHYYVEETIKGYQTDIVRDTTDAAVPFKYDITNTYTGGNYVSLSGTKKWEGDSKDRFEIRPLPENLDLRIWRSISGKSDAPVDITDEVRIDWTDADAAHDVWKYSVYNKGGNYLFGKPEGGSVGEATLCRYAPDGSTYIYYVEEVWRDKNYEAYAPNGYDAYRTVDQNLIVTGKAGNDGNVTAGIVNKLIPTDYAILKKWQKKVPTDAEPDKVADLTAADYNLLLPSSITFNLEYSTDSITWNTFSDSNGPVTKEVKKDKLIDLLTNNEKITFTELPMYDKGSGGSVGSEDPVQYRAIEQGCSGIGIALAADYATVTNTIETIPLTIEKTWDDDDDRDGVRPTTLTFYIIRDGKDDPAEVYEVVLPRDGTVDSTGNVWKSNTIYVPKYKDGAITKTQNDLSTYAVREASTALQGKYTLAGGTEGSPYTQNDPQPEVEGLKDFKLKNVHGSTRITVTLNKTCIDAKATDWGFAVTDTANPIRPKYVYAILQRYDGDTGGWVNIKADTSSLASGSTPADAVASSVAAAVKTLEPAANGTVSCSWPNLLARWNNGQKYLYRVIETNVSGNAGTDGNGMAPSGYQIEYTVGGQSQTIVPTVSETTGSTTATINMVNQLAVTDLKVEKIWKDINGNLLTGGPFPYASAEVKLQYRLGDSGTWTDVPGTQSANPVRRLTSTNSWKTTYASLPVQNNAGTAYQYRVVETKVNDQSGVLVDGKTVFDSYTTDAASYPANGEITVTNTLQSRTNITVGKIWDDADDQDGIRPDSVSVVLKSVGNPGGTPVISTAPIVLNAANGWQYTWKDLPKYRADGSQCTYQVVEEAVTGSLYTISYSISGENGSYGSNCENIPDVEDNPVKGKMVYIKNNYTPRVMNLEVTKEWKPDGNNYETRPTSVMLELQSTTNTDGITGAAKVSRSDNPVNIGTADGAAGAFSYTWAGLPIRKDGKDIYYSVVETPVNQYKTPAYEYTAAGSGDTAGSIAADAGKGVAIAGNIKDTTAGGATHSVKVINELDTVSLTVEKQWADHDNLYGSRPHALVFTLQSKTGTEAWENVKNNANNIVTLKMVSNKDGDKQSGTFENLLRFDTAGNKYSYRAIETAIITKSGAVETETSVSRLADKTDDLTVGSFETGGNEYQFTTNVTADKTIVTNTLIEEVITLSGTKRWLDDSNYYGTRPEDLEITVHYQDNKNGSTWQKVDAEDYTLGWVKNETGSEWTYTVSGLLRYSKGEATPRIYGIKETVPTYYSRDGGNDGYSTGQADNGSGNITEADFTNRLQQADLVIKKERDRGVDDISFEFTVKYAKDAIPTGANGILYAGTYEVYAIDDDTLSAVQDTRTTNDGTVTIKASEKAVLPDLPQGYYYAVTEADHDDYELRPDTGAQYYSQGLTGQINTPPTPTIAYAYNMAKTKLKIENDTKNPGISPQDQGKTNAGGMVKVITGSDTGETPDQPNEDEYQPNEVAVIWQPETYWALGGKLSIVYTDFAGNEDMTITIEDYLTDNQDGTYGVKKLSDCKINGSTGNLSIMRAAYPNIADDALSIDGSKRVKLVLANSVAGMPKQTDVQVVFEPTLAVRNITQQDAATSSRHGTVQVEGGNVNDYADGVPSYNNGVPYAREVTVHGVAEPGYKVHIYQMFLRNMDDLTGTAYAINVKADNTFTSQVETMIAGVRTMVAVSGRVNYTYDAGRNYVTGVDITLDTLPIPLQIDLLFVTEATVIDPPKPENQTAGGENETSSADDSDEIPVFLRLVKKPEDPAVSEEAATASAVARTGDDTPIVGITVLGIIAGLGAFLSRKKKKES